MKIKIEVDDDNIDRIVVKSLKRGLSCIKEPFFNDGDEKELIDAFERLIKYYSPSDSWE